jgi:hypothetical protein
LSEIRPEVQDSAERAEPGKGFNIDPRPALLRLHALSLTHVPFALVDDETA